MARPLRIIYDGAYYHVINRGQGKRKIFLDKKDYSSFLNILCDSCRYYKVTITSYCLMQNHYHLIVHTPHANLPEFMRQVNSVYTQQFNVKYKSDGPLFKGRYKAIVVQEGSYLLQLVRYIHMNPVKAGIVKKIKDFKNSSHTQFLQKEESTWLKYLEVLQKQFSVDGRSDFYASYCSFMNKGDDEITTILEEKSRKAAAAIILGDDRFIDEVKKNYLHKKRVVAEIPQAKQIHNEIMIKKIKKEVINEYGKNNASLYTSTRGKENISRMMAIGLARECSGYPYEKIAEIFGGIQYKSAAKYYERLKDKCKSDSKIKKVFGNLKQRCSQVET